MPSIYKKLSDELGKTRDLRPSLFFCRWTTFRSFTGQHLSCCDKDRGFEFKVRDASTFKVFFNWEDEPSSNSEFRLSFLWRLIEYCIKSIEMKH